MPFRKHEFFFNILSSALLNSVICQGSSPRFTVNFGPHICTSLMKIWGTRLELKLIADLLAGHGVTNHESTYVMRDF